MGDDQELIERARDYVAAPFSDEPYEPGELRVGRHMMREMITALADRLEALAGPMEREGWVLVPREPTEAMINAAMESGPSDATKAATNSLDRHVGLTVDIWTAMLSAAPKP
jgi:hypothetical protein